MIKVSGNVTDPGVLTGQYPFDAIESEILDILSESSEVYEYTSTEQLLFETILRSNIAGTAIELDRSRFSFRTFRKSFCNEDYWARTDEGGFLQLNTVKASDAIRDIFVNSSKYGTECATAIVIVFFKALLDTLPSGAFNELFSGIYLMDWQHLDRELGIQPSASPPDYLPGDCRYFKNPDVDPLTPEWQGENVIVLGSGLYYGHGLGIRTYGGMINGLNKYRVSGSEISAYLTDSVTRPNFKFLAGKVIEDA